VRAQFQDGRRHHVGNSTECYKMSNYHRTLMKIGTKTQQDMLIAKVIKPEVYSEKTAKIKCKKRYSCQMATLYEREL
jgi:hypothetical protein